MKIYYILLILSLISLSSSCTKDLRLGIIDQGEVLKSSIDKYTKREIEQVKLNIKYKYLEKQELLDEADIHCKELGFGRVLNVETEWTGYGLISHNEVACELGRFVFRGKNQL